MAQAQVAAGPRGRAAGEALRRVVAQAERRRGPGQRSPAEDGELGGVPRALAAVAGVLVRRQVLDAHRQGRGGAGVLGGHPAPVLAAPLGLVGEGPVVAPVDRRGVERDGVGEAERPGDRGAQQPGAGIDLGGVRSVDHPGRAAEAVVVGLGVVEADTRLQLHPVGGVQPRVGAHGQVVERVGLGVSVPGVGLGDAVGVEAGGAQPQGGLGVGQPGGGGEAAAVVGADLGPGPDAVRLSRDHVDDAADRVRPPERGLRPRQDLDPLHVEQVEGGEVETARRLRRIVHRDPVDQHQGLVGGRAAQDQAADPAERPGAGERRSGNGGEQVAGEHGVPALDLGPVDDLGARHLGQGLRQAGGGDHHLP